jgi:hypothetical protein
VKRRYVPLSCITSHLFWIAKVTAKFRKAEK